jgi:hypothetical protein
MFGLAGIRIYAALGVALAVLVFVGWALRVDQLRGRHLDTIGAMKAADGRVLRAVRAASENPKLLWADVPDQVGAIAASRNGWKLTADLQSQRIDELAQETARLKALGAQLRAQAEAAIARRETVIRRLETIAMTPGERADCARQLAEAEAALDAVWEAGL